ncbi:MAG: COX15/CtaA family protein [Bacteroidota bacterium]
MKTNKSVLIWLITGAILIAAMVVVGGITRLTNSGLSMVEWEPVMGTLPPMNETDWQDAFTNYKSYPEYKEINYDFTLEDFKSIFWWEYAHRLLGRIIGVIFIVPFLIFWIKGYFDKSWILRLLILLVLGAGQGVLGWFMVKSGLVDNPDVSHYRLAAHLIAAILLFSYTIWLALDWKYPEKGYMRVKTFQQTLLFVFLVAIAQITYGAFMAGLKAGLFYPTYPKMNGDWIPAGLEGKLFSSGWVFLTSNITAIQFMHRWLAILLTLMIIALYYNYGPSLIERNKKRLLALVIVVLIQVGLGIITIVYNIPIIIALLHQITALALIAIFIMNMHGARVVSTPN